MTTVTNIVLCVFTTTTGIVTNEVIFSDGTKDTIQREVVKVSDFTPLAENTLVYDWWKHEGKIRNNANVAHLNPLSSGSRAWRESPVILSDEDIVQLCSSIVSVAGEDYRNWADSIPLRHEGKTIGFISKEEFLKAFKKTLNYRASAIFRGLLNTKWKEEK